MKKVVLILFLIYVFISNIWSFSTRYSYPDIQIDTIEYNDKVYVEVKLSGSEENDAIGFPNVPILKYTFVYDSRVSISNVRINGIREKRYSVSLPLKPVQPFLEVKDVISDSIEYTKIVYSTNEFYPSSIQGECNVDYLREKTLVTICVHPIQYNPILQEIRQWKDIEVSFSTSENTIPIDQQVRRSNNPSSINIPFYDYVIVTKKYLFSSFMPLVLWKRAKGYNVGIVDIDSITNNVYLIGDEVSQIFDDAGKLRQYLIESYNTVGTHYVLLGGDYSIVPVRYGSGRANNYDSNYQIPSDLYFADVDASWNKDSDSLYGEPSSLYGKEIDYGAEMFVGRLLCTKPSEVSTWVKKVLQYELNPGNGDYDYLGRALFTEADQMQDGREAEQIDSYWNWYNSTILREDPTSLDSFPIYPKGADVIDSINTIHYGLISNFNHGGPCSFGTATCLHNGEANGSPWDGSHLSNSMYLVTSVDSYSNWTMIDEIDNGFDRLTNSTYPSIVYSISCSNMPFDDYGNSVEQKTYNLGEVFTCLSLGGGPAYLGNTRTGYVFLSKELYKHFIDHIQVDSLNHLGMAEAYSKWHYKNHHLSLSHNLLGCPEMSMWTQLPRKFDNLEYEVIGNSLIVDTHEPALNTKICLSGRVNNTYQQFVVSDKSSYTFDTIPDDYILVVTKPNFIPYIVGNECFIQNETIVTSKNYDCNVIEIGSEVNYLKPYGEVTIEQGGEVTIPTGEVVINGEFEVKLGGVLNIHQ